MSNTKATWNVLWIGKTVYVYVKAEINQLISSVNTFGGWNHSQLHKHLDTSGMHTQRGKRARQWEQVCVGGRFLYPEFSYKWKICETGQIWRIYSEQGYQAVYLFHQTWSMSIARGSEEQLTTNQTHSTNQGHKDSGNSPRSESLSCWRGIYWANCICRLLPVYLPVATLPFLS